MTTSNIRLCCLPTQKIRPHAGFTLIELLTVIAIIGILAAIIIPTVGKVRESARKAANVSNIRQIAIAHMMYRQDNKGVFSRQTTGDYTWISDSRLIISDNKFAPFGYLLSYLSLKGAPNSFTQTPDVLMCPFYQRDSTGTAGGLQHTIKYQPTLMAGYQLNIYSAVPTYAGYTEYRDPDIPARRVIVADLTHWWDGSLDGIIKNGRKPWDGKGFHVGTWSGSARWIKLTGGNIAGGQGVSGDPPAGGRSQWEGLDKY
ncbi:type II secretion system protein [Geminisphaera colitermitum]|uniref:type II secretion system protein n=1 Tax=Geminisphaera colitermitum TaxID=1148786 RepID=UPI000158D4CE|nr:prepilin-type N-terminal cleavage/methylation domain-containing protein [Geminisphaera colitermitum]